MVNVPPGVNADSVTVLLVWKLKPSNVTELPGLAVCGLRSSVGWPELTMLSGMFSGISLLSDGILALTKRLYEPGDALLVVTVSVRVFVWVLNVNDDCDTERVMPGWLNVSISTMRFWA